MSSKTVTYWGPRQVAAAGFLPVSPLTDAAIEGIADETGASRQLFRVAQQSVAPYWNPTVTSWRQAFDSILQANCYVGAAINGAASHGTNRQTLIGAGVKAAVYVTELELPNGSTYMPAGDWTVRLHFISDNTVCSMSGAQIILVNTFTQASTTYWGTDGSASTVIHTHTPGRPAVLNSSGTYTLSFTTASGVTVPTGSKIAVLCFVTNASTTTTATFNYRHNRNILTPWEEAVTISLDPVNVGFGALAASGLALTSGASTPNVAAASKAVATLLAITAPTAPGVTAAAKPAIASGVVTAGVASVAVAAKTISGAPLTISAAQVGVAASAKAAATLVSIAASVPGIVAAAKPVTTSTTVAAAPAAVAVAAVAVTVLTDPQLYSPACVVASPGLVRELTATGHAAARTMQTPTLGRAFVQAPSTRPVSPRATGCRFRAVSSSSKGGKVVAGMSVNGHISQAASARSLVGASKEVRQRSIGGESTQAVPNSGGPTLVRPLGVC